ncbi:putative acid phosphatase [Zalerion maritima]|uniref:Acid phosphatase n=1 Tax=Zalerion maritima TaxID=339359 RepID=A0AAD5WMT1_9PEZI|nr:putative acid phosphatase [Zalerion maritima]
MMLPDPTVSLSLPSLDDGLVLDCRVYHPLKQRNLHAAIVAHPYAPLGGSFDDPVVDTVAGTLLRLGFIVGTFNFRGAAGSAGRTSWTSKPERLDYMSMVGFMAFYVHHLDKVSATKPVLLHAGYSYGAMITSQIPPLNDILDHFSEPAPGSSATEIRLRAQNLASQFTVTSSATAGRHGSPRLGIRIGGDEDRRSIDARRSTDTDERLRRGVHDILAKAKLHRQSGSVDIAKDSRDVKGGDKGDEVLHYHQAMAKTDTICLPALSLADFFRPAYLMVSPLQGVITTLATMSFLRRGHDAGSDERAERKLVENPALALFGDQDVFVAAKRLRQWGARLEAQTDSQFRAHEISTAGHFWIEDRVLYIMRDAVGTFASELLK